MSATRRITRPSPHQIRSHGARARDCLRLGSRPKEDVGVGVAVAEPAVAAAMLPMLTPICLASTSRRPAGRSALTAWHVTMLQAADALGPCDSLASSALTVSKSALAWSVS